MEIEDLEKADIWNKVNNILSNNKLGFSSKKVIVEYSNITLQIGLNPIMIAAMFYIKTESDIGKDRDLLINIYRLLNNTSSKLSNEVIGRSAKFKKDEKFIFMTLYRYFKWFETSTHSR